MKRVLIVFLAFLIFISMVIGNFVEETEYQEQVEETLSCQEFTELDSLSMDVTQYRGWLDYYNNDEFCGAYNMSSGDASSAAFYRNTMDVDVYQADNEFWGQVYSQLYEANRNLLADVQDSLIEISNRRQLDRVAFARLVVAMVQDIPYEFVMPDDCAGRTSAPCNAGVRFGIYSPAEFLYGMKGDCDTRTVLLFTLLANFGYQPVIVNSVQYGHSMLALDIPAAGDDFEFNGRRYAYWETTNVGWLPGMLPPDMNNKNYWSVALSL